MKPYSAVLFLVLLSIIVFYPLSIKHVETQEEINIPVLAVTKTTSKNLIDLGEKFTIIIKIKNIGTAKAYNITLKDALLPKWSVEVEGTRNITWPEIPAGTEITHTYNITIKTTATNIVYLGRAIVSYYDENQERYVVYSEDPVLYIKTHGGPKIDWEEIWKNMVILESAVLLLVFLPLIAIEYKTYSEYKREMLKKKE